MPGVSIFPEVEAAGCRGTFHSPKGLLVYRIRGWRFSSDGGRAFSGIRHHTVISRGADPDAVVFWGNVHPRAVEASRLEDTYVAQVWTCLGCSGLDLDKEGSRTWKSTLVRGHTPNCTRAGQASREALIFSEVFATLQKYDLD